MQNWHETESYFFFKKAIQDNLGGIIRYCERRHVNSNEINNILNNIYKITVEKTNSINELKDQEFTVKWKTKALNKISNLEDETLNEYNITNNRFDKEFHFTNDEIKQNVKAEFKNVFIYTLKKYNINVNDVVNDYLKVNKALNDMNNEGISIN